MARRAWIGLDVEGPVCAAARQRAEAAGLNERVEIMQVSPGPMPLPDGSAEVVFSKDSIVHIGDKDALASDVFRVLRPGGWLAASDWLIGHDGPPSPEMEAYLRSEDLDFGMASPARYRAALKRAGFEDIRLTNRNAWYRGQAQDELARLEGPRAPGVRGAARHGRDRPPDPNLARHDRRARHGRALPAPSARPPPGIAPHLSENGPRGLCRLRGQPSGHPALCISTSREAVRANSKAPSPSA